MKGISSSVIDKFENWLRFNYTGAIREDDAEKEFEKSLDDIYDEIRIGNICWSQSYVLAEMDPTAYRCAFLDWLDGCYPNEIEIGGEVYYTEDSEEEIIDVFLDDNESTVERCSVCEQVCLRTEMRRIDRSDPHSDRVCKDCRNKEKEDKQNARNK